MSELVSQGERSRARGIRMRDHGNEGAPVTREKTSKPP